MILQDACELRSGQVRQGRSNRLESSVVGGEDCHIGQGVNCVNQIRAGQRSSNAAQAGIDSGVGYTVRDGQDGVNDVDNAAGEILILSNTSAAYPDPPIGMTYCRRDGRIRQKTRVEYNIVLLANTFNHLTARDIRICRVIEHSGDKGRGFGHG